MGSYRLAAAVSFLVMSGAMIYAHLADRLFPGVPLGVLTALAILLANELFHVPRGETPAPCWRALPFIVVAATYRAYLFAYPASLPGVDPPRYASAITGVIQTGNIYSIDIFFYSQAPLSISYPAMLGIATGAPGNQTLGLYPLVLGLLIPAVVAALSLRMARTESRLKMAFAVALAVAMTASVRMSIWPIAQSLGIVYWTVLLLVVTRYLEVGSKRLLFLGVLTLVAQVYTHKLPLLIILGVVAGLAIVSRFVSVVGVDDNSPVTGTDELILIGIICTLLIVQWAFITDLIVTVVIRSQRLLFADRLSVVPPPPLPTQPTDAAPRPDGPVAVFFRQGHWILLLAIGGVAWLVTAYRQFDSRSAWFLLASIAIPVALLIVGFLRGTGPPPLRTVSFFEPALAPVLLIALGSRVLKTRTPDIQLSGVSSPVSLPPLGSLLTAVGFLCVISVQVFTPVTVLDFPNNDRIYLNEQELSAKSFGYQHVDGQIRSDWFVQVSGPPDCENALKGSDATCISGEDLNTAQIKYYGIGLPLLNGNVTDQGYEHVLYRTEVEYFRTNGGVWRLLWDPEQRLDADYNRVYTNGGAVLHDRVGSTALAAANTTTG